MSDIASIITDIKDTATTILKKDITVVQGFSERQVAAIAQQTKTITDGLANGDIDADLAQFFFEGLKAMAQNFVNTLKGILSVTLEKLYNALVDKLWGIINGVI
ncbi:MAG: hypothetical protein R2786_06980 [Flavobacteriaceae bacterium]